MADPFAEQMAAALAALLLENPGVARVSLPDGRSIDYRDLRAEWEQLHRRATAESGVRPRVAAIRLDR